MRFVAVAVAILGEFEIEFVRQFWRWAGCFSAGLGDDPGRAWLAGDFLPGLAVADRFAEAGRLSRQPLGDCLDAVWVEGREGFGIVGSDEGSSHGFCLFSGQFQEGEVIKISDAGGGIERMDSDGDGLGGRRGFGD